MKIVIVGGVAGGASAAARIRRLDEFAEIVMYERGPNVSFSNCALPFHLSEVIEDAEQLVLMNPQVFHEQYRIDAKVRHEVLAIDRKAKEVKVKNLETGDVFTDSYDKLVLSPGAAPIIPQQVEISSDAKVLTLRNVEDVKAIKAATDEAENIAVIGAGFIGMEVVENLVEAGKNVSLIELLDQVMAPFDLDMAQILHRELHDQGVDLHLSDGVKKIDRDTVYLSSGKELKTDLVVMAIGVRPENQLAKDADLELGMAGSIKVNHNYQTSDPDIYAVGDAIETYSFFTGKAVRLAMAGPAQRQARAAADHIYGRTVNNTGVIGSSVIRCFDLNAACTGLNEKWLKETNIPYDFAYVIPMDKVGLMPDAAPLFTKILFAKPSGRLLGAQVIGKGNADKRVDVMAAMIMNHATVEDLKELELCYSPPFGTAKDALNHAALVALNLLNGDVRQVAVSEVRALVEAGEFIIDAREEDEFAEGHLNNAVNIPLSQFRDRLDEIPKDRTVYIHCRSSQRSYNMCRALNQRGYDAVNISGSYLGICVHEYFTDQKSGRKKILDKYNFN